MKQEFIVANTVTLPNFISAKPIVLGSSGNLGGSLQVRCLRLNWPFLALCKIYLCMGLTTPPSPSGNWSSIFALCCPTSNGFRGRSFLSFQLLPKGTQQILVPSFSRASPFLPGSCDFLEPGQPENRCQTQRCYLTCSCCLLLWELQRVGGHTERWQSLALNLETAATFQRKAAFIPGGGVEALIRREARENGVMATLSLGPVRLCTDCCFDAIFGGQKLCLIYLCTNNP